VHIQIIKFDVITNFGQFRFSLTEDKPDFVIIMFDILNEPSYRSVPEYYNKIINDNPNAEICICGNKVDEQNRVVRPSQIVFHKKHNLKYYDLSVKSCYNFDKLLKYFIEIYIKKMIDTLHIKNIK